MRPVGTVHNRRTEPIDDGWDLIDSRIELDPAMVDPEATTGLMDFSHVEVVYVFDRVDEARGHHGAPGCRAATRRGPRSASSPSGRRRGRTASAPPCAS